MAPHLLMNGYPLFMSALKYPPVFSRLFRFLFVLALFATQGATHAAFLISDFSITNPLFLPYGGSTWASPNQWQSFTDGLVTGQEVIPVSGGSPTVAGGAFRSGLSLNLTGLNSLALTMRLLSANQATVVQILLFDADGTHFRYDFPTNSYNTSTFVTTNASNGVGIMTAPGTVAGLDLANITTYEVQGNYYDPMGAANAPIRIQLDTLEAVSVVPEPGSIALLAVGMLMLSCVHSRRLKQVSARKNCFGK